MRVGPVVISATALAAAACLSLVSAGVAASVVERVSQAGVRNALVDNGFEWVEVGSDGLQVQLSGTAPTEADRFRALSITGEVVESSRVIDNMEVTPANPVESPEFTIEILRNGEGISLIGLIPAELDREQIARDIARIADGAEVVDLLETADYPVPDGWETAMDFGFEALARLPRSKISITDEAVRITAISNSGQEKRRLEAELRRAVPDAVDLAMDISAPRPVITPFTLRFLIDEDGARFDACSADTEEAAARILAAARKAGLAENVACTLGLGVPTPAWSTAVTQGIAALAELGGGSVTFSDADVSLVALDTATQDDFDRVVGELESGLPDVFSLHSVLPEPVAVDGTGDAEAGPPEFVATLSPEGQVQIRGRVTDEQQREAVESFARARFGIERVYAAARVDDALPDGWPVRVLSGLQALSELEHGAVVVQPAFVSVKGETGNPEARAEISRLLSDKLGESQNFEIDVVYKKAFDPIANLPSAEECVRRINAIQSDQKIAFDPGSTEITGNSIGVVDRIADVLKGSCSEVELVLEIGGHTDSQGREVMNLELSQARADAVLEGLMARRVLTADITARGYGETTPIADNDTEQGREENRRIEFRLVLEEADPVDDETAGAPDGAQADDAPDAEASDDDGSGDGADNGSGTAEAEQQ